MAGHPVPFVPKPQLRSPKYVLELRHVGDNEPTRHPTSPHATPVIPRVHSSSQRSGKVSQLCHVGDNELSKRHPRSPHAIPIIQRVRSSSQRSGKVRGVCSQSRKPLEYEDIYNIRVQPSISKGSRRSSMRERAHRVVNGGVGNTWNQGKTQKVSLNYSGREQSEQRDNSSRNMVGVVRCVVGLQSTRGALGVEHEIGQDGKDVQQGQDRNESRHRGDVRITQDTTWYNMQQGQDRNESREHKGDVRITQDTTGYNMQHGNDIRRERRKASNGHITFELKNIKHDDNIGYSGNMAKQQRGTQSVVEVQSDKAGEQSELSKLRWNPHQTSFPRHAREPPSQAPNDVVTKATTPQNMIAVTVLSGEPNDRKESSESSDSDAAPTNFFQPPRPTRSASPAPSVGSIGSFHSNVTQNSGVSAKSEVSVKSILKKPRVGRVVLKEEPPSYTALAILSCILCFPFGIYALNKSANVKTAIKENDYEWAFSSSKQIKNFCIRITVVYLLILAVGGGFLAKYLITGNMFG